ncbi:hypothetical protein [Actinoplanes auranticolor]|uniref:Uncharacterized protein n=1 Tax=Actinoplanes auranticolor TaxID=47988 RepID=A0A919SK58_9ACTN|nr:hypothetical protein [Actinoplanes auranticolor]GIM73912.1 hypothetical protein Aau02nite_58240 [Actinoplanes auranticolor]
MASVRVFLESGFDHDEVTMSAGGAAHEEHEVTTRYQVGLAKVVDLTLPDGEPSNLRITVRNLSAEAAITPEQTPYVRVNATATGLTVEPESAPPMYG